MGKLKVDPNEAIQLLHQGMDSLYVPRRQHRLKSNRASMIGLPCDLYHVRQRLNIDLARPPSPELLRIFEIGNNMERSWIARARGRWRIFDEQRPIEDRNYNLTGTLEGRIGLRPPRKKTDRIIAMEIKSVHPVLWERYHETIDGWRDFEKNPFHMRWIAQGQSYLHMLKEKWIMFILLNKSNLREKFIPMYPDPEILAKTLARAKRVNKHVADMTYPEPIVYDKNICGKICPFSHICFADRVFDQAAILDDQDVLESARICHDLYESHKSYDRNWAFLKDKLRGIRHGFVGTEFEIINKPVDMAPQPEKVVPAKAGYTQWRLTLRKLSTD